MSPITGAIIHMLLFISLYFEVFLLLVFLEKTRKKDPASTPRLLPRATVIVPCYNEERTVDRTIRSLLALRYPAERLQIIVIDDGSTDETWAALQVFSNSPQIRLLQKENGGKHTALNLGLTHATGEIIGCLDADSTVDPDALIEIVRAFEDDQEVMAMTPAIITTPGRGIIQNMQRAEYSLSVFMRRALSMIDSNFVTPGPFSFFRKDVFATIGTYREAHNTEDLEIALRMQSHGLRIGNAPSARVYTNTPATLGALIRQRVRWTYGFIRNFFEYRFMLFRPRHGTIGMFVLPVAFFSIVSALIFFGLMISSASEAVAREAVRYDTIGFSLAASTPEFDWFYFNTGSYMFLIGAILAITLSLLLIGRRLAGDARNFGLDMVSYFLLYGFIAPLWLSRAAWRAIRAKKTDWAAERRR